MAAASQPQEHAQDAPSPALIFELLNAHRRTAALQAAIELDLFRALGEGPSDAAALAKACSASERGMRILCDYLTIIDVIEKENGLYRHSPTSGAFLDPRSPMCVASISRFLGNPAMRDTDADLAQIVRDGRTSLPGEGSVDPDNPIWVEFAHSMAPMMAPAAGPLGAIALNGLTGPVKVLDLASGHGLFGIACAKQNPQAQIVAVDWSAVLEVAKANASKAGVADRFALLPGSAFDVDYGGPYDVALITNFLHHFDVPTCVALLKKIHASLRPGGRAATLEFVPNEDRVTPPMSAAFSLIMLMSTKSGDAYTFRELESMYREAGFHDITAEVLPRSPHTVVTGIA
jgi:2-polyprenyl-3-methyl-5-hydroxy-6-metoxy-1,4-benzoquinol methylase